MQLNISTEPKMQVIDITEQVTESLIDGQKLAHVFVRHSTAAIGIADLDPGGTDLDYLEALEQMIPKLKFRHPHDPTHMPDHILAMLVGPDVTVPVLNKQLALGTWQRIILFEFDGPRDRTIQITAI